MSVNTKPIGVAYEDQNIIGADKLYSANELGFTADAQGTVTQLTSKTTAVTLNKSAGTITMHNASLATATNATFTLNNNLISANDIIILTLAGGQATPGSYNVFANALAAGSVSISLRNISGGSLSEAVVVNFALIHCQ
tara:strand:+ start:570 stop:986 length:417 start_codon:yes stop_codon:yes gene_type:complete